MMETVPATDLDQSNFDWIQSYPFNMEPATNPAGLVYPTAPESWRPSLGLNTYDFGLDNTLAASRKFSSASNALSHSSVHGLSPAPSLLPSVSSVQSSPHTSPIAVDPVLHQRLPKGTAVPAMSSHATQRFTSSGVKRSRDDYEQRPPRNVKLDEENRYLVYLRDQQRLPWKEISRKFEQTFQRPYQAPALQMRYGRLKNRLHPWTDADTNALQLAQEYYANKRFEIISEKMLEFGASDVWSPRVCARKLRQLEKDDSALSGSPSPSQSADEGPPAVSEPADPMQRSVSPQFASKVSWRTLGR